MFVACSMSYNHGEKNNCLGHIETHHELEIISSPLDSTDTELLKRAVLTKDEGGLCMGSIFVVKKPIVVYRVWNKNESKTAKGRWWTFDKPTGTLQGFREDYEVCCQWGPKNKVDACSLKVGSKIVVGPGQSVDCTKVVNHCGPDCKDTRYEISEKNQVFILVPEQDLENCVTEDWPKK